MNIFRIFTTRRIIAAALAVFGIVMFVSGFTEASESGKPREELYALEDFDLKKGQYLSVNIDEVIDNYAETTEETTVLGFIKTDSRGFSQHYTVSCADKDGNWRLVSIEVTYADYINQFAAVEENTWAEDESLAFSQTINLTGRVSGKLDPELAGYACENLIDYGIIADEAEFNAVYLPMEIRIVAPNAYNPTSMFIIGAVCLVIAAGIIVFEVVWGKRNVSVNEETESNQ
jgi:hypothetical protein